MSAKDFWYLTNSLRKVDEDITEQELRYHILAKNYGRIIGQAQSV